MLDGLLGGGWPLGVLIELLVDPPGSRELALLVPALGALSREPIPRQDMSRDARVPPRLLLVAPPHIPYAPGLRQRGVPASSLVVVRPREPGEIFWAMEEALNSRACTAVIAWAGPAVRPALQRLQFAAGRAGAFTALVRPTRCRTERSPAALRLQLGARPGEVEVFRNRRGRPGALHLGDPA